jgi:hypothetical protein
MGALEGIKDRLASTQEFLCSVIRKSKKELKEDQYPQYASHHRMV